MKNEGSGRGRSVVTEDPSLRTPQQPASEDDLACWKRRVEAFTQGIQECDSEGRIAFANSAFARMHGFSRSQLEGQLVWDLIEDSDAATGLRERLGALVESDSESCSLQMRHRTRQGSAFDAQSQWSCRLDCSGRVVGFVAVVTDVSQQRQAERRMLRLNRDSEKQIEKRSRELVRLTRDLKQDAVRRRKAEDELVRRIGEQAAVAELGQRALAGVEAHLLAKQAVLIVTTALHCQHTMVLGGGSDSAAMMLRAGSGWPAGTVGFAQVNAGPRSLLAFLGRFPLPLSCEDSSREDRFDVPALFLDHEVQSFACAAIRARDRIFGVLGACFDQTRGASQGDLQFLQSLANILAVAVDRSSSDEALRRSQARLRLMTGQMPALLWTTDFDLRLTSAMGALLSRLEQEPDSAIGMALHDFLQAGRDSFVVEVHRKALQGQSELFEMRLQDAYYQLRIEPLRDRSGRINGAIGLALDISDRRRIEDSLLKSEERSRAIFETVVDGIICIDHGGFIESFNPAAERIFGYSREEAVGRNVTLLMSSPEREEHDSYIERYLRSGNPRIIGDGREVKGRRKDGTVFPLHLGVGEMRMGSQRMFVGIVRDLTEHRQMQEDLLHAQSMAGLGEMAASVAHEIKNPLAAISGVIEVLQDSCAVEAPYDEVFAELADRVRQLDHTVKRLLQFSKAWEPFKQSIDLCELAAHLVDSAKRLEAFSAIRFVLEGEEKLVAPVDLTLFEEVLWNLAYNASEAMPQGGEVRLGFSEVEGEAIVTVTDDGPGIAAEDLPKLFRPFYSTRSKGTGLGLSICRKIVRAHGGSIRIESQLGEGTSVILSLPLDS